MEHETPAKRDFFISYNGADKTWAEWIAWQLEAAGYTLFIQAWDFRPGSNFVLEMDRAATLAERTLPVLSPNFLAARFTQPEWAAAFKDDPTGEQGRVLPVRVTECDPKGLLGPIVYVDLVGRDETAAKDELLRGVRRERAKPEESPAFPGAAGSADRSTAAVEKPARFPGALPPIWNVPHLRNPHFTGRDELLEELHQTLARGVALLSGLGGIGKTQTAVEYAYRHHTDFDLVWWLPSEEPTTLLGTYAALAGEMKLPEASEREIAAVAQAARRELEQRERWLLVLDNAREESDLRDLLPRGGGRVLITSRNPDWDRATCLDVPLFRRASAVAFLLKRTGQGDEAAAGALAAELGDLPLALEQAAAFSARREMALAEYLDLFGKQRAELWRREKPPQGYPDTVRATWVLAVNRLTTEEQPAAVDLLNLCAFLAPEAIPSRLLTAHREALSPPLNAVAADPLAWGDLVEALRSYSLVEVADGGLSFHRLVQATTRDRLAADERQRWAGAAVALMNAGFPYAENDPATWAGSRELLAHALAAAGHAEPLADGVEGTVRLLNVVGLYLRTVAEFDQAKTCLERALKIDEAAFGPDHPSVATDVNNLGLVLRAQGDLAGARAAFERALRIDEAALGPDHPNVAIRLGSLGHLLVQMGERAMGIGHLTRALTVFEKFFAADHPYVVETRRRLRAAGVAGFGGSDQSG